MIIFQNQIWNNAPSVCCMEMSTEILDRVKKVMYTNEQGIEMTNICSQA